MPADTAVAEVTTSNLSTKPSFLDEAATMQSFEDALRADGVLSPTVPRQNDETLKAETAKTEITAEPKAEVKAAAPVKDDDEIPADIKSPGAQSSWKKLKESKKQIESERDAERTALQTLRAEYEEFKKKTPGAPNLDEIPEYKTLKEQAALREKEAAELSDRLRLVDVEQHPKFQEYFKGKTQQQLEIAKEIGGDKLLEALKLPAGEFRNNSLRELVAEMDPLNQAQLGSVLNNLRAIDAEKASEIAKARDNFTQLQNEQKSKQEKQQAEVQASFQRVAAEVTDKEKGLSVFQERAGDEEWNKGVRERLALAQHAFQGKLKPEDAARMSHWAAAAEPLMRQNKGLVEKVSELEKTIMELRAADPNPGGDDKGEITTTEKYVGGLEGIMAEMEKVLPGSR